MLSARIEAIRKTPLFSSLEPEELTAIARRSNELKLGRGEILFLAGDTPHGLWVIVAGAVRAYRVGPDGPRPWANQRRLEQPVVPNRGRHAERALRDV